MTPASKRRRLWLVWLPLFAIAVVLGLEKADIVTLGKEDPHRRHGHQDIGVTLLLPIPFEQIAAIEVARDGARFLFERDWGGSPFKLVHTHGSDAAQHDRHGHDATKHDHGDRSHSHDGTGQGADQDSEAGDMDSVQANIDASLAAFGRARAKRKFAGTSSSGDYGFDRTNLSISIYRSSREPPVAIYKVGGFAPDTLSRYIKVEGVDEVMTIAQYQIENLDRLLTAAGSKM